MQVLLHRRAVPHGYPLLVGPDQRARVCHARQAGEAVLATEPGGCGRAQDSAQLTRLRRERLPACGPETSEREAPHELGDHGVTCSSGTDTRRTVPSGMRVPSSIAIPVGIMQFLPMLTPRPMVAPL